MESSGAPPNVKRRNNEKRKEKSRDAARCRRSRESEIFADLAGVLPLPTSVVTHLDKASVMRLVIAHLRITNMFKAMGVNEEKLQSDLCDQFYLQSIGGIVLVISLDGDIIYISNNVSSYLGVSQVDLLGQSFFDMIHLCDHQDIRDLLSGKVKINGQISVFVRVKCSQSSKGRTVNLKAASYKVLHIQGRFLKIDESPKERFGFVTIATPIPHPVDIETPLGSYIFLSKHSLDMKFTYADERMTEFLGYNPDDLIGESMYNFHHVEDNREIMKSFKSLFEKGQSETSQYRFMAQGGGYIWVCTQATLLFCEKKNIPLSVVCVNYVISGKCNAVEVCSREQLEWIKEKDTSATIIDVPEVQVTAKVVSKMVPVAAIQPLVVQPPTVQFSSVPSSEPLLLTVSAEPELGNSGQSPRPRPATSEIFGPRTADMNKGFLTFSDDESGSTVLKEEPEDLTHLAPTAGDACVPLSIPSIRDGMMCCDILSDEYSPLINQSKETPLFSSYNDNSSRSLSPALTLSPNVYCGTPLCGLSDDGPGLEDATSLLGLDILKSETELDKTGFIHLSGSNGLPLLTTEFLWDVSSPASPSPNYSLGVDMKTDALADFSGFATLYPMDEEGIHKKCPDQGGGSPFGASQQPILSDLEKRKRVSSVEGESVKKRKHGPDNSVLMNLLIEGRDVSTGYTYFDSRTISGQVNTQQHCMPSINP